MKNCVQNNQTALESSHTFQSLLIYLPSGHVLISKAPGKILSSISDDLPITEQHIP